MDLELITKSRQTAFAAGIQSGASSIDGIPAGDEASYEYDSDLVAALSTSLKVKF